MKKVSQDIWSLKRDVNIGPPKYKEMVLATQPQRLVLCLIVLYDWFGYNIQCAS